MKLKETLVTLALVASVFYGLFTLTANRTTSQTPAAFEQGDFIVVPLNGQPTAIQKPNAQPLAQPAKPVDGDKWQNPAKGDDGESDDPNSFSSKILGPFSVAMLLLGITLWAMYEVGRKRREQEQKNKRNGGK